MIINCGLGARPGEPRVSVQKLALNLLHATQWAAEISATVRLFDAYGADPTLVIIAPNLNASLLWRNCVERLAARADQAAVACLFNGHREFIGAGPFPEWDDKKFLMQDGLSHHQWMTIPYGAQAGRAEIPRRDYGPKGLVQ